MTQLATIHAVRSPRGEQAARVLETLQAVRFGGRPSAQVIPLRPKALPEPVWVGTLNINDFVEITGFRRWSSVEASRGDRA